MNFKPQSEMKQLKNCMANRKWLDKEILQLKKENKGLKEEVTKLNDYLDVEIERGDNLYVHDLVNYGSTVTTTISRAGALDNSYAACQRLLAAPYCTSVR